MLDIKVARDNFFTYWLLFSKKLRTELILDTKILY